MKNVLLFAPYFIPRRRVSAMRPFRFAIHLREFGWQPTVVCIAAGGCEPTPKERQLLEGIEVVELVPPLDRTARSENQLGAGQGQSPPSSSLELVRRLVPVDSWLPFLALQLRKLARIVRQRQVDVIWATADPWSSVVLTEWLSAWLAVPWVADFRDPWTLSADRNRDRPGPTLAVERLLERKMVQRASRVIFTARRTAQQYRSHYGNAIHAATIYNSFAGALFNDPIRFLHEAALGVGDGRHLHIGFFGKFRATSSARAMIEVLAHGQRVSPRTAERIRVHSFGPLSPADARLARERGVLQSFVSAPAVPPEQALSALRRFDILLVGASPGRSNVVPAKLFECMAAGRPILSLTQNPEVQDILERTGTGIQLPVERPEQTFGLLEQCLLAKEYGRRLAIPFEPRPRAVMAFEARSTTAELAQILESAAGASSM